MERKQNNSKPKMQDKNKKPMKQNGQHKPGTKNMMNKKMTQPHNGKDACPYAKKCGGCD